MPNPNEICTNHYLLHELKPLWLPWLSLLFIPPPVLITSDLIIKINWRGQWQPTPEPLPEKSHGRRSLVGCSLWGRKESDTTERLHFHFSHFTFIHWRRKWQPTPLFLPGESQEQGSLVGCCLRGHTSRTWLKWLSSSSSWNHPKWSTKRNKEFKTMNRDLVSYRVASNGLKK